MHTRLLKGANTQHSGHMGQHFFQTELMAEINFKCPARAIDKLLLMKLN